MKDQNTPTKGLNIDDDCTCNYVIDKPCPYHEPNTVQNTPTNTLEEQDLIDELEQIEAIISPDSVMAPEVEGHTQANNWARRYCELQKTGHSTACSIAQNDKCTCETPEERKKRSTK